MPTPPTPPPADPFVQIVMRFNPVTGEFQTKVPDGSEMLALAMLELGRHQILRMVLTPRSTIIPVRTIPRVS